MATGKLSREHTLNHREENAELLNDFVRSLDAGGRSPHTIVAYRHNVGDFLDFTLGVSVSEITHSEINEWLHFLKERGSSASTISQRLSSLRAFFDYMQFAGIVKSSPTRVIPNRRVIHKLPRWISIDNMQKLLGAADNSRDRALVELMWTTGCRISEVVGARIENVDWVEGTIKVFCKGNKERLVPFGCRCAASLRHYLEESVNADGSAPTFGPLFRRRKAEQQGCVQLQGGRTWIAFYRETVKLPDGTVRRMLRGKKLGTVRATNQPGSKPDMRVEIAAALRLRGQGWREIHNAIFPDAEMDHLQLKRFRNAVYRFEKVPKRQPLKYKEIASFGDAKAAARKLVDAIRARSPNNLAHTLFPKQP
jgi:site-specific recombinase XerD